MMISYHFAVERFCAIMQLYRKSCGRVHTHTFPRHEHREQLAKKNLVATESRAFHPDNIPFEEPDVWDSAGRQ